jgi:hypothetical protein
VACGLSLEILASQCSRANVDEKEIFNADSDNSYLSRLEGVGVKSPAEKFNLFVGGDFDFFGGLHV